MALVMQHTWFVMTTTFRTPKARSLVLLHMGDGGNHVGQSLPA